MPLRNCRVCGRPFFPEPLLRYENMPKSAQKFPDAAALAGDAGTSLDVFQCSGCGLAQLDGEPVPYFREVIRAAAVSAVVKEQKAKQFEAFIGKHSLRGRKTVEIGCGKGEFLSLLGPLGVDAYGLEGSAEAAAHCAACGLKVERGYLEDGVKLREGPFDAFLLLMFLEHMPDPNAALRALRENLAPGAPGLVEVPNFDMLLRKRLFSEFISDHLLYFSRETFASTLALNGFEILELDETRDSYVLSASVRRREPLDVSGFRASQERIAKELADFAALFGSGKVAVWGAGHQALALIALTQLSGSLRYVVDSAPFKQGKFTPATHLPVVPPSALNSDPVDAVIVMAASYSDEVAGILRRDFPKSLSIAILREDGLQRLSD